MKKTLLPILALGGLLLAASCQMSEPDAGILTGEVDFTVTAGIPGGITTYAEPAGSGSHNGGAMLLDPDDYTLRYTLQVYDKDGKVAYYETKNAPEATFDGVTFDVRLLAKVYDFVFWADFVKKDGNVEFYNVENLKNITYADADVNAQALADNAADAYYKTKEVDLTQSSQSLDVTLQRPFGKIRLIATDALNEHNQQDERPQSVTIDFGKAEIPTAFDALAGQVVGNSTAKAGTVTFDAVQETSMVNNEEKENVYLLGFNYIFESSAIPSYSMDITVTSDLGKTIGQRSISSIPVQENKLTTVIGNFYTNESSIDVIVEDGFVNGEEVISADKWDGHSTAKPVIDEANKTISINSPAQLAGLARLINNGNTYEGYTATLLSSVDLDNHEWTPLATGERDGSSPSGNSFKGTFDGNGNTIYNLSIAADDSDSPDKAIGFFGIVDGGTVKNLKFENVNINVPSSEMAAAAVGMLTGGGTVSGIEVLSGSINAMRGNGAIVGRMTKSGTISACTNHATISGTGANVGGIVGAAYYTEAGSTMTIDDCHNYGTVTCTAGAVGGIVGLSAANVSNCTNDAAITGNGADVAGITAEQQNAGSITNCVNRGDITNNAGTSYGTGGIVGWIRYSGTTDNYPAKNIIEVRGNTNYGSVKGGNDAGGIVGTVYNLGTIAANYNYAPALSAATFAAGIVGNTQFTETAVGMEESDMVYVTGNFSSTSLDNIQAPCKDLFVYINDQDAVTQEDNTLLVNTAAQLSSLAAAVNGGNTRINVALGADIDLGNTDWTPIGTKDNEFQGIFDGQGHTISNLKISEEMPTSTIAGLFGRLNGIVRNLVIDGVDISHISDGSGGTGIVAGSIFTTGLIENVTVRNAKIKGNRWTGGIVGYSYGSVKGCSAMNIEITLTPDKLTDDFDNGDKAGGIVGMSAEDNTYGKITGNRAENITIKGYRDLGGIAGSANGSALTGNTASNITITVDQITGWYGDKTVNAGIILGRNLDNYPLDGSNSESGENSISKSYLITSGSSWINDGIIRFAPESNSTYYVAPGEYDGIQVFTNGKTNVSMIAQDDNVTINGKATFGTHSNQTRSMPESNTISGFTVKGELFLSACGTIIAENNKAAQLTVKTFGLTEDPSYTSDITLSGNTADGSLGAAPQEYGIYIVPNVTGYKLTVDGNTIKNVKSHGFTIQGSGDGSAKTTVGEYSITNNNFESWGLGGKDHRGAVKVWADIEIAPSDMGSLSVSDLSEKAKEFVTHILQGGNTFGQKPANGGCIFEFYGLPFDSLE